MIGWSQLFLKSEYYQIQKKMPFDRAVQQVSLFVFT